MVDFIKSAEVLIFDPDNDSRNNEDLRIPESNIASVSTTSRLNRRKDTAEFEIINDKGQYTENSDINIRSGQRIEFEIITPNDFQAWGDSAWGKGGWGGKNHRWTGAIRDVEYTYDGPHVSTITLTAEDFVFGIMSKRLVFDTWSDRQVAGTSTSILNEAVRHEAPEINRTSIEDFNTSTWISADGTNLLDFAIKLAQRTDNVAMFSDRRRLHFKHRDQISTEFTIQPSDVGFFSVKEDDSDVANVVRVDGGVEKGIDDEQLTQDGYLTATDSGSIQFQVATRKAQIEELDLWTKKTGSEESVTIRIQKDDAGSPVAPGDNTSDIVSESIEHGDLTDDGFTTFNLGDHTLPEPNPWVIVQTDGGSGQDIGVNTQGTSGTSDDVPTYKVWYAYTITVRKSDATSVNKYRKREARIKNDSIRSSEEARAVAQEKLNHDAVPTKEFTAPAESLRSHLLSVGDVVDLDFPREKATGNYIVSQLETSYDGIQIETEITAEEVQSI